MEQTRTGKRKPNLFDLLVILLLLAAAVGAYLLLHGSLGLAGSSVYQTATYTFELAQLEESQADAIAVGDTLWATKNERPVGTVVAIEQTPYVETIANESTGLMEDVAVAGYVTLYVTMEVEAVFSDSAVTTVSGLTLYRGQSFTISNGSLYGSVTVVFVEREAAQ